MITCCLFTEKGYQVGQKGAAHKALTHVMPRYSLVMNVQIFTWSIFSNQTFWSSGRRCYLPYNLCANLRCKYQSKESKVYFTSIMYLYNLKEFCLIFCLVSLLTKLYWPLKSHFLTFEQHHLTEEQEAERTDCPGKHTLHWNLSNEVTLHQINIWH